MSAVYDMDVKKLIGDLNAPPGSIHWCVGMRERLQEILDSHKSDHESLERCIEYFINQRGWEKIHDSKKRPFKSFIDFCKHKRPLGLGRDPAEIDQIIAEGKAKSAQELVADQNVRVREQPGNPTGHNQHTPKESLQSQDSTYGNSSSYLVGKLKRDAPQIAEALGRGEYPSARAAGIAAGIVKVPTPLGLLKRSWAKASKSEKDQFLDWINEAGW